LWVALAGVALCLPLAAVAQESVPPEQRLIQLINQARLATGLGPLAVTPELSSAAESHARDMVQNGYMEHTARDGSTPQQRAARFGYNAPTSSAWMVLEVISARQTPEAAANWLLSDALHRGVLLRKYWREMGAAYVQGGPYGQMWVVEFGCRPNVLPITAEPNSSGGVTVRLSNEECTPTGSGDTIMGKATEVMVSDKPDFSGATWEPFVTTKVMSGGSNVFVKYRDSQGRVTMSSTQGAGGPSPVVVTAASAATTTLNMASPPSSQSGSAQAAPAPAAPAQGAAPDPGSDAAPAGSNLFEPKPGFVFQPGVAKP